MATSTRPALVTAARGTRSTIALKILMAGSGLLFIAFVLVHMYGNLKAFQGEAASRPVTGPIIYYRHPDEPTYSAAPRRTEDERDFVPVRASEDVSFDDPPKPPAAELGGGEGRRVLYYRNPMGLPDTSPTPKKDSMGMDYIPVHEGEVEGGNIVCV